MHSGEGRSRTDKLALLVRAGEIFHRSLDIEQTLYNVARLAVESFADICLFDLMDESSERLYVTAGAHRDPAMEPVIKKVEELLYNTEFGRHPVLQVTITGEPFFVRHFDEATIDAVAASRQHASYMRQLSYQSKIVVPVLAHNVIFGALTFISTRGSGDFDESDVNFSIELGRRAGLAVANAKQYGREQLVATTLQNAFLTKHFPEKGGLRFHALYRPALSEAELGGDWYDAFESRSGKIVITIGDVAGKGVEAARLMVQIRQAMRIGVTISEDPSKILSVVNDSMLLEPGERLATAFVAVYDPRSRRLSYASAGHPAPLCRRADGTLYALDGASPPLGVSDDLEFETQAFSIEPGSLLVAYTDGLTEAHRDAVHGEELLKRVLSSTSILRAADPARFVQRTLCGDEPRDDIAVMVVSFGVPEPVWHIDARNPRAVYAAKDEYLRALQRHAEINSLDMQACEVIFGELVGNCVRHAPGAVSFSLELADGMWLNAIDDGKGFQYEPKLPFDLWSESGRGLFIVSCLARSVFVERLPGRGTHVRVELPLNVAKAAPPSEIEECSVLHA